MIDILAVVVLFKTTIWQSKMVISTGSMTANRRQSMKKFLLLLAMVLSFFIVFAESKPNTKISVNVNGKTLEGELHDTALAAEIKSHFPLKVYLYGWGGREFYGSLDFTPKTKVKGQFRFDNGDITYCAQNNSIAIFYAQTSRPNLTMEVVPIGKITSDLSVFSSLGSGADFTFENKN